MASSVAVNLLGEVKAFMGTMEKSVRLLEQACGAKKTYELPPFCTNTELKPVSKVFGYYSVMTATSYYVSSELLRDDRSPSIRQCLLNALVPTEGIVNVVDYLRYKKEIYKYASTQHDIVADDLQTFLKTGTNYDDYIRIKAALTAPVPPPRANAVPPAPTRVMPVAPEPSELPLPKRLRLTPAADTKADTPKVLFQQVELGKHGYNYSGDRTGGDAPFHAALRAAVTEYGLSQVLKKVTMLQKFNNPTTHYHNRLTRDIAFLNSLTTAAPGDSGKPTRTCTRTQLPAVAPSVRVKPVCHDSIYSKPPMISLGNFGYKIGLATMDAREALSKAIIEHGVEAVWTKMNFLNEVYAKKPAASVVQRDFGFVNYIRDTSPPMKGSDDASTSAV